jgi:hypothetical protein
MFQLIIYPPISGRFRRRCRRDLAQPRWQQGFSWNRLLCTFACTDTPVRSYPMAASPFPADESLSDFTVVLHDDGRELLCQIEQTFAINGQDYCLLLPIDHPLKIFVWQDGEDEEEEVLMDTDEDDIDAVFATARAVLAEQNLTLKRSAVILTVAGELPEATEEACMAIELDEVDEAGEPQVEEFQILSTCFYQDEEYTLCTPLNPLLMFASRGPHQELSLVEPEEFELIRSELEEKLFDVFE